MSMNDNPIRSPEDDVLGRTKVAGSFVQQVLSLDAGEGAVVGVLGPWGSGKSSFLNLARDQFEDAGVVVLDFNPWMFSGADQLVEAFFVELATQLKIRPGLEQIGKDLEAYGETFAGLAWLPLVGSWIERGRGATKALGTILQRRKEGIAGRRNGLEDALRALDRPIVVVLDDIDRLTPGEIRDVFRLVRLIASFPNLIHVLAFDRMRVEAALAELGVPGRDYLEKFLQIGVDLPAVPAHVLDQQTFLALGEALVLVTRPGPFDDRMWPGVFAEIIHPLIRNMRDVRRYAAAIRGTVQALEGKVALVDVLALEAIRVFLPDVFRHLHAAVDGLATPSTVPWEASARPADLVEQVEGLIGAAGTHVAVVVAMIERLFPAASERHFGHPLDGTPPQWLRERRVAHRDMLHLYLERLAWDRTPALPPRRREVEVVHEPKALVRQTSSDVSP